MEAHAEGRAAPGRAVDLDAALVQVHAFLDDVQPDARALDVMQRKSGQMGVPQLWINGKAVVGFDRLKIDQLLNIKQQGEQS